MKEIELCEQRCGGREGWGICGKRWTLCWSIFTLGPNHVGEESGDSSRTMSWETARWGQHFRGSFGWKHGEFEGGIRAARGFPGSSAGKESACNAGDLGLMPVWKGPLKKGIATHSTILAWRIPWTEEPGILQSMGSRRVRHDWVTFPSPAAKCWNVLLWLLLLNFLLLSGQHNMDHRSECEDLQTPHVPLSRSRKSAERIRGMAGSSADPQSIFEDCCRLLCLYWNINARGEVTFVINQAVARASAGSLHWFRTHQTKWRPAASDSSLGEAGQIGLADQMSVLMPERWTRHLLNGPQAGMFRVLNQPFTSLLQGWGKPQCHPWWKITHPCRISPCHFHCTMYMNYRVQGRQCKASWQWKMHRSGIRRPGCGSCLSTCSLCDCGSVIPLSGHQCSLQGLLAFMSLKQFSEDAYRRQQAKWLV